MNKYQDALDDISILVYGQNNYYSSHQKRSIDVLQELVDKETPIKPIENHYEEKEQKPYIKHTCPRCEQLKNKRYALCSRDEYCPICGQALDWSDK